MAKLANRAKMTISSTGTGNITLAAADTGYQTFAQAGISDGDVIRYIVEDASNAWEIGTAVVSNSSTVLARTVEESSNSGNALNLTSAAKVFVGITAKDLDGNVAPQFLTTPPTSLALGNDGSTAVTLNVKAYDEQGFPVNYTWDANIAGSNTIYDASSLPPQFASAPSINQSTGVFSIIGSSNSSHAGTVNLRAKASDGVMTSTHVTACNLEFMYNTGLLAHYDVNDSSSYTSGSSTWSDISGNSGPTLTVDTSKVTFASSSIGSLPTLQITGANAVGTNSSLGSTTTCIMIGNHTSPGSQMRMWTPSLSGSGNTQTYLWMDPSSVNPIFAGPNYFGPSAPNSSATKVYLDKTLVEQGSNSATYGFVSGGSGYYTTVQLYNNLAGPALHSVGLTAMNLSNGWQTGSNGATWPRLKIRALLFFDHEVSATNIAGIHDFYKSQYSSNSDMSP